MPRLLYSLFKLSNFNFILILHIRSRVIFTLLRSLLMTLPDLQIIPPFLALLDLLHLRHDVDILIAKLPFVLNSILAAAVGGVLSF